MAYDQKLADAEAQLVVLTAERERLRAGVDIIWKCAAEAVPTLPKRIDEMNDVEAKIADVACFAAGHLNFIEQEARALLAGVAPRDPIVTEQELAFIARVKRIGVRGTDHDELFAIINALLAALGLAPENQKKGGENGP